MNLVEEDLITWCGRAACARVSLVAGGAGAGRPLLHHRALRVGAAGAAGAWVRVWGPTCKAFRGFGSLQRWNNFVCSSQGFHTFCHSLNHEMFEQSSWGV